jgi:predicted RNA-binding Zn-ribbon protein involved in translation (DUF1610 family)
MKMAPSNTHVERQPSHKATLYCPSCGHASRINGDWILQVHPTYLDYECPECGEILESRSTGSKMITHGKEGLQLTDAD